MVYGARRGVSVTRVPGDEISRWRESAMTISCRRDRPGLTRCRDEEESASNLRKDQILDRDGVHAEQRAPRVPMELPSEPESIAIRRAERQTLSTPMMMESCAGDQTEART